MAKQIWLGPLLGSNRSRLIARCSDLVSGGRAQNFLYLTASHPLLALVTDGILAGSATHGLWGEFPVYLFRGFVSRILSSAVDMASALPLEPRVPIDREELPLKRSLISQILRSLVVDGRLKAIGPLASREGCVNAVSILIGEIQRAAKTPEELQEIIAARSAEHGMSEGSVGETHLQADFDREVALIYATYADLLERNRLTEDDANDLRALQILRGQVDGQSVRVPWLEQAELLVLDGFFDFTPVQGEILRLIIPQFSEVIVNLNKDESNPEIFKPFDETIEQLRAIAHFSVTANTESAPTPGALSRLRTNLFNASLKRREAAPETTSEAQDEIRYFECTDRETEIRTIAKEIKRLVLVENYKLSDIALVVRERASYAETIARVMQEESLPCNLDRRVVAARIPAERAVLKLLAVLEELARDEANVLKMPELADQIKSGYFRLSREELESLAEQFDKSFRHLLCEGEIADRESLEKRKRDLGIGRWDPDALENVIAYIGSELRLSDWLDRCRKLVAQLPAAGATKELLNIDAAESIGDDEEAQLEGAETLQPEDKQLEKKRRPQRDVSPAAMAWATLVIKRFADAIQRVPREAPPAELRAAIMSLLDQFQFRSQVQRPARHMEDHELSRATLDLQALEALRRALLTTIKSIQFTERQPATAVSLTSFIDEVRRCLGTQTVTFASAERGGLRVLEATDVRGLRFRAIFIAGLVEGGFPLSPSRDWIYPHEERERLKRHGLTLEDISPDTLLKEEHYFYQATCRATERLYVTRPLLLEADTETVPSYYIEELRRAVAPALIRKEEVARPDYDGKRLGESSSARELTIGLVRQEQRHLNRLDKVDLRPYPQVSRLLSLARNDGLVSESALRRIAIERERCGENFGSYDGRIDDPNLLALIRDRFGPEFVHSASSLSTFGNCPYRFFAQRVLKLEPRGEAALDLQALDAGKLLHDILRRFFERHRGQRLNSEDHDELRSGLLAIADEVFDQHQKVVPPLNKQIWKLDREIRKIILEQILLFELATQENSAAMDVRPTWFELAFGSTKSTAKDPDSINEPLALTRSTLAGEETIKISGQIDRVDIAADRTLLAYDYKLSKGARKEDISEGRNLQIPIYLEALEQMFFPDRRIAGGGYYTLRGGPERRNTGMYRAAFSDYLGLKKSTKSILSETDWKQLRAEVIERIWEFLDRMRTGSFTVEPSEGIKTCKFCDYVAVCRYEKYRIEHKQKRR